MAGPEAALHCHESGNLVTTRLDHSSAKVEMRIS